MATPAQIVQAYRCVYKASLYAVRYSKPGRYIVRDEIRSAFRRSPVTAFDVDKIKNTLEFLEGAGKEAGMESKILKSLCEVIFKQKKRAEFHKAPPLDKQTPLERHIAKTAYDPYYNTIAMLNDSMGMCLPTRPY